MAKLLKQFQNLEEILEPVKRAVAKQVQVVRGSAVYLCPANHGELRGSIYGKTEVESNTVIGTVYTNKEYAAYVEFGTGPNGEESHEGISPEVNVTYSQNGWWFSGDSINPSDASQYGWPSSEGEDGTFYFTKGQAAQPFMYPALKQNEKTILANIKSDLQKEIEVMVK